MDWVPKESEIKIDKVGVDIETSAMLKKRFGEDFFEKIKDNLEVKANEQPNKRDNRKKRVDGKREGRAPRAPREKGDRPDRPERPERQDRAEKKETPKEGEEGAQDAKREGRRRGRGEPREGQE